MYVVVFSGPEPIVMPILQAQGKEHAAKKAQTALALYLQKFEKPYQAGDFKVEKVAIQGE